MNARLITLILIIFAVAVFRLLPHPPNVSPVAAMALFGGAYFSDKRIAFIVPLAALLLSDVMLGLHDTMVYVYAGFALTVAAGFWVGRHTSVGRIALAVIGSSVLFFLLTNFGAWMTSGLYPMTAEGLLQAYIAGIPFFQNSLLGNAVFTALLFGGFSAHFYAAYNEAWPLDSGYKIRRALYNLYHILNHYNLFGGGYGSQAQSVIARLLAEIGR